MKAPILRTLLASVLTAVCGHAAADVVLTPVAGSTPQAAGDSPHAAITDAAAATRIAHCSRWHCAC